MSEPFLTRAVNKLNDCKTFLPLVDCYQGDLFSDKPDIAESDCIYNGKYLADPDCPLWYMGIFCPFGYDVYASHMEEAIHNREEDFYRLNRSMYALDGPIGKRNVWGPGRVHCTWPNPTVKSLKESSEKIEEREFSSKTSNKRPRDENFLKLINAIRNPEKQDRVIKVINGLKRRLDDTNRIFRFSFSDFGKDINRSNLNISDELFSHLEALYNIIFELSGLEFDRQDISKTDHFQNIDNFNQLNVSVKYFYWDKHVADKIKTEQNSCPLNKNDPQAKLSENDETPFPSLKKENRNKKPPCATLLVGCGMMPQYGAGYGAVKNWGIELPDNIHQYMSENEEDRIKMENKCRLQHLIIMDSCSKIGMDRQCSHQLAYDLSFWQISHLSDKPDFSKWNDSGKFPKMSATEFNEQNMNRYPEMQYDRSKLVFNECKYSGIFCDLVYEVADSLFDTFPEFNNPTYLNNLLNNKEPTKKDILRLNELLKQSIKEKAPFFQNYLLHYSEIYGDAGTPMEVFRRLRLLPSKNINSLTIVNDIPDSLRELYEVKIDSIEELARTWSQNCTFELRLFPARFKRFTFADTHSLKACIPAFDYELELLQELSGYERSANLYDYGKMEYTDEYGNKQVKLFILTEKIHGRAPAYENEKLCVMFDYEDTKDDDLINRAFEDMSKYIRSKRKKDMGYSDVFSDNTTEKNLCNLVNKHSDVFGPIPGKEQMRFRIINEKYAKCFGCITTTETLSFAPRSSRYDFKENMKGGLAPEF